MVKAALWLEESKRVQRSKSCRRRNNMSFQLDGVDEKIPLYPVLDGHARGTPVRPKEEATLRDQSLPAPRFGLLKKVCRATLTKNTSPSRRIMGKKRPASGGRGDPPKRFKEDAQINGGPPKEKGSYKKNASNAGKQKVNLVRSYA